VSIEEELTALLSSIFFSTSSSLAIKLYCWILIFFEILVWVIIIVSTPSWGLDLPLATALFKTFLLRMLNDS
jgi:hypothetical protein